MNYRQCLSATIASSLALMLCQCDDGGANIKIKGLKDELDQLNHQHYDTQQQVSRLQSQIEASRAERKKLEDEKAKVEVERESARKDLQQLQRDFETYKTKYKLSMRQRAPGLEVGNFTSADGKSYQRVVLKEITDTQVNFTHDGGIMKLHYKDLPESLQDMLGFLIEDKPVVSHDVSMLTPKQQNLQARAARDTAVTNMEDVLSKLRLRREPLLRNIAHMEEEMRQAKNAGESVVRFEPTIQKYKLLLKQLESEILKAEVDLHAARANVVKLVPER
jgi:chromosome segregation ATPase